MIKDLLNLNSFTPTNLFKSYYDKNMIFHDNYYLDLSEDELDLVLLILQSKTFDSNLILTKEASNYTYIFDLYLFLIICKYCSDINYVLFFIQYIEYIMSNTDTYDIYISNLTFINNIYKELVSLHINKYNASEKEIDRYIDFYIKNIVKHLNVRHENISLFNNLFYKYNLYQINKENIIDLVFDKYINCISFSEQNFNYIELECNAYMYILNELCKAFNLNKSNTKTYKDIINVQDKLKIYKILK